jgi:hypothetical protein
MTAEAPRKRAAEAPNIRVDAKSAGSRRQESSLDAHKSRDNEPPRHQSLEPSKLAFRPTRDDDFLIFPMTDPAPSPSDLP